MCGIAGILSKERLNPNLQKMVSALRHRGPDDRGEQVIENTALGNTRLAIIDLSPAGHMPMNDPDTGNWVTFNGEVYNFQILRQELEKHGAAFHSATDTEVVLNAYRQWGTACVEHFRGMFAFALWDASRQELFLARDRLGEKPLYYFQDVARNRFLFASEIRALLASGLVERRLDPISLSVYLHNGFPIAPRTILQSVYSLMPGCWMRVDSEGRISEIHRYWCIPTFDSAQAAPSTEEISDLLAEAVRMRMISDVPLGAFLSGGLDSSTLVALMSGNSGNVRTFSVGFREKVYDESGYASWVAKKFKTAHTAIRLGQDDFEAQLDDGLRGMDQPTYDGLNTYFVARAARESGLTVALSGLGGDELFGGYPFFKAAPLIAGFGQAAEWLPMAARNRLARLLGGKHGLRKALHIFDQHIPTGMHLLAGYQTRVALFPKLEQDPLLAERNLPEDVWFGLPREFVEFVNAEGRDPDPASLLSRYVMHLFEGERTLRDSDSLSMAVSLEVRTAFTDHLLVEALWKIPGRIRCAGAPDKPYQLQLARPILGDDFPARRKQGFTFPFQEWLANGKFMQQIEITLRDTTLARSSGLHPHGILTVVDQNRHLPWSRVWAIFVLMYWVNHNEVRI